MIKFLTLIFFQILLSNPFDGLTLITTIGVTQNTSNTMLIDNEENIVLEYNSPEQSIYELCPYDKEFFIILNLAIGGTWGGVIGIDKDSFPQHMYIDYVKVSELRCLEN